MPDVSVIDTKNKTDLVLFDDIKQYNKKTTVRQTKFNTLNKIVELSDLDVSSAKEKQFHKSDIYHSGDLLNYFPRRYIDYSSPRSAVEVDNGDLCSMIGTIKNIKSRGKMLSAYCIDEKGYFFTACWFNQSYLVRQLQVDRKYIFCGKINIWNGNTIQIIPTMFSDNIESLKTFVPVYKKIKGMSNDYLTQRIDLALSGLQDNDYLTEDIIDKYGLMTKKEFFYAIHHPKNETDIKRAIERYVFDRLFQFNFVMKAENKNKHEFSVFGIKDTSSLSNLMQKLPYTLTPDQDKTIKEIIKKMSADLKVSALVQGDVGSGKTIVAFSFLVLTKDNGFQGALIAPTEVLAKQHFQEFQKLTEDTNIKSALLTGSTKTREKKKIQEQVQNGEIDVLIGTHALIQKSLEYKNLGLLIIDEQHKFGVEQRDKLIKTKYKPHTIIMSATPIPRTLSMAVYGDSIDVYNIKTKPAGRKDVITKKVKTSDMAYDFIHEEIKKGKQAYIICPLINMSDSEKMADVESVEEAVEEANVYFHKYPDVKISSINGKMKQEDIEKEISEFYKGNTDILISTTIVEVGVNVPNASVIFIKNSERFGLAQAHQLRGRVGRSDYQSYCLLLSRPGDQKADILCKSSDGFVIAQEDLKLRGSGDFLGTKQSGTNEDVELMLAFPDLYQEIAIDNDNIYKNRDLFNKFRFLLL